jgi:hypothetical protein
MRHFYFGEVTAEGGRGRGVLVGPRLLLTAADVLFDGSKARAKPSFHIKSIVSPPVNIVEAWKVEGCALAEF